MAAVPQRTLNWLYSVLIRDHYDPRQTYQDPNRTYYDVASVLAQYPSLSPRTEVYTYENGFSALLLQLTGTVPVTFRGTVYKFPISLWVPNTYPREPPIVYVTPTQDMAVRVGQHVTLEGRVYHHYLAHWAEAWERSTLVDLVSILREVFAKEPPVRYKQQQVPPRPQQPGPTQTPPPLPPLPAELGLPASHSPLHQNVSSPVPAVPPPPPPKPGQAVSAEQQQPIPAAQPSSSSPLPPLPPKEQDPRWPPRTHARTSTSTDRLSQYPLDQSGMESPTTPHRYPQQQHPMAHPMPVYTQGPLPSQPDNRAPPGAIPQQFPRGPQQQPSHSLPQQVSPHRPSHHLANGGYQQMPPLQAPQQASHHSFQRPSSEVQPAVKPKAETPDLLTSPFEVELPSFAPGPAPPIPPNPEKDALLHAVSKALAATLQTNVSQTESAARSLQSQSDSLHAAIATLQGEISSLNTLNSSLQSNTSILQQSLHRADAVIADAQSRISPSAAQSSLDPVPSGLPPIDEVLVAPTVVGKQLYDLVAEERGIQQAIYALQTAHVKGVIGVETWSRHTRGLAREAFLKRALIRKIGKGMGLDEYQM
ncbi:UEV domain-containing protein [Aspergillus pseudonomiae]|uniref:UEV domain-containing protein n=1 Tax=Aspergillus pseudonomiae TaxID=1506151 RepID=A0A5N7D293_9EURO|nr:UEV domain-containing protein [Aspergillus pseudonomiae]KAB8265047.1 UEV domain-containing protein [Aspergillus pseudonomiae]KAE8400525.1 UEV domain-containing protein [Aspergillus pseudonomiae]